MIRFPMRAKIECMDGPDGELMAVIIDPVGKHVTHLAVRHRNEQRLVPVEYMASANADERVIRLHCRESELQEMEQFTERRFIHSEHPETPRAIAYQYSQGIPPGHLPYGVLPETDLLSTQAEYVPRRELIIHYGAPVKATDGPIGHVSELQIGQDGRHISRLVARSGIPLRRREKCLPLTAIDHFENDLIYLRWDRHTIEQLPGGPP